MHGLYLRTNPRLQPVYGAFSINAYTKAHFIGAKALTRLVNFACAFLMKELRRRNGSQVERYSI